MSEIRTEQVYGFIQAYLHQQGYPPNFEETQSGPVGPCPVWPIARSDLTGRPSRLDEVGQVYQLPHQQVLVSLGHLEAAGRLRFCPDRPRSLRLRV